jgi:hypothetical protein
MPRVPQCRRALLLTVAFAGMFQVACATPMPMAGGTIPPSVFQFAPVVPYTGPGPGGWKAAQVHVLLARLSSVLPEAAWCAVEVGVPEVNLDGPVSDATARIEASVASNLAAQTTLQERLPTAILCNNFIQRMDANLKVPIKGSTVTKFRTPGLRPTRHPAEE